MTDTTTLIADALDAIGRAHTALALIAQAQDENSDDGNEQKIIDAENAVDTFADAVESIVP